MSSEHSHPGEPRPADESSESPPFPPPVEFDQVHEGRHRRHDPPWKRRRRRLRTGPKSHRQRKRFFVRLVFAVGLFLLPVLATMALLSNVLTRWIEEGGQITALTTLGGCSVALALPLLAMSMAAYAFRKIALPLADIMTAADTVAAGDFTVRLKEEGPREFRQLSRSFNHMTSELERAQEQRRNLTADVAHELRTPLHIIQGNLEGIIDKVYEPDQAHLEATLAETRSLARLVEDLRTLSLAEAGQLPLNWEEVNITTVLDDIVTSFSGPAEAAGVTLIAAYGHNNAAATDVLATPSPSALPAPDSDYAKMGALPPVSADYDRLNQILTNLMVNALRHTPAGGSVTLAAQYISNQIQIHIADTGAGIPAADLPFIFDRFWRGDRARTHSDGAGSGLGLAISRQLVQAHGGSISVSSQVGEGTTFTLKLPVTAVE